MRSRFTWDTAIYTDKILKHNRPDITLVHKDTQKWTPVDIAVPADQNITRTEEGKVETFKKLAFEIKRIHGASKVTEIPIAIGPLGSISKRAKIPQSLCGVSQHILKKSFTGNEDGQRLLAILLRMHMLRMLMLIKDIDIEILNHAPFAYRYEMITFVV